MPLSRLKEIQSKLRIPPKPGMCRAPRSQQNLTQHKVNKKSISIGDTSIRATSKKPGGSLKSKGLWKHNPIYSTDPGLGKHHAGGLRRKQESNFFVTINTNRSRNGEAAAKCLKASLTHMSKDENLCNLIMWGPKHPEFYGEDKYNDHISSVEIMGAVEAGEHTGNIHAHWWVTFTHWSQIQLNGKAIAHMVKETFNAHQHKFYSNNATLELSKLPYVSIKLLPQSDFADVIKGYMNKTITDEKSDPK